MMNRPIRNTNESMLKRIPLGKPSFGEEEIRAVSDVVASCQVTRGQKRETFEKRVANYCGADYAVAVSSGTAALHLVARAIGLESGKRCWTTPISFVATANCALYCGAEVDFVDINPATVNMDVEKLEIKLKKAKKSNLLPDVVIPVHFAGQSCDMKRIANLAKQYNFRIIEDACHALGGAYLGYKVGSCHFSDASVFSFHPLKSISTGEGGMILTNDESLYKKMLIMRHNGITTNAQDFTENHGAWYYEQKELGFNYWLTDIQSAIGICQMDRLNYFVKKRNELVKLYDDYLSDVPVKLVALEPHNHSACHLYVIRLDLERTKKSKREIFEFMKSKGIGTQVHYIPIPAHPYYRKLGFCPEDYPEAWKYYKEAMSLPLYPGLDKSDMEYVVTTLKSSIGE